METTPKFASEEMAQLAMNIRQSVRFYRNFKEAENNNFDFSYLCSSIVNTVVELGDYKNTIELMTAIAHTVETSSSHTLPQLLTEDLDDKLSSYGALVLLCVDCLEKGDYPKKVLKDIKSAAKIAEEQNNETN